MHKDILIDATEEKKLIAQIQKRTDIKAERLKRVLALPDLSRTEGSPLKEIVTRAKKVKSLEGFDDIKIPEIVPTEVLFDLFNMPPGHSARSESDTYYVDENHVLRPHDTVFWYYYLSHPEIKKRIENKEILGAVCYGKVYRKDEIDRTHMNVFHQFGAWLIAPDDKKIITPDDLKNALSDIATNVFGANFRFYEHQFPYTDPSYEMEAEINGKWVEMVGSGIVRKSVLANMGLTGYNGWAFGFGLERLAIANMSLPDIRLLWSKDSRVVERLKLGQKFIEVSKYPAVVRDISFIIGKEVALNNYYELVRDEAGDSGSVVNAQHSTTGVVEQVEKTDEYENEGKFGADKKSYTFRIVYRSLEKTLTNEEVNKIHDRIVERTKQEFGAVVR